MKVVYKKSIVEKISEAKIEAAERGLEIERIELTQHELVELRQWSRAQSFFVPPPCPDGDGHLGSLDGIPLFYIDKAVGESNG